MSYFPSITQNVVADTNNSTVANLASNATFVGVATDTLNYSGLQILFKADQNCTVYVDQGPEIQTGVGTVTTNGTTTLTGSSTKFLTDFIVGDQIFVSGETVRVVASVVSDTSLTVTSAFSTSTAGLSYTLYHWDASDSYNYNVIKDNFGLTTQLIGTHVRVRVKNIGLSTTTYLRLDVLLAPIINPLPRSLDEHSHLKTTVEHLSDGVGNELSISPIGTAEVDQPYRLVGTSFGSTLDTNFWTATNSGTSSVASIVTPGLVTLTSGTSSGGYGNVTTVRQARFIFAHPHKFRAIVRLTAVTVANSTRRWGAYTAAGGPPVVPVDGFYFELSGAGVLSVNYRNAGGTVTTVSSGSFNGDVSAHACDTNAHAYEITHFLDKAQFTIDGVLIHTFTPTTAMMSSTFNLPASFMCTSSAISSSATMEVWAGMILRQGRVETSPRNVYQPGAVTAVVLKQGPGVLRGIVNGDNVGTVIFYDAVTATNIIASFDLARAIGSVPIGIDFSTGLTYTTTGSPKLTVIYE